MGFAVAAAAREAGAEVVLVTGPVSLPTPAAVRRIDVETAEQMYARSPRRDRRRAHLHRLRGRFRLSAARSGRAEDQTLRRRDGARARPLARYARERRRVAAAAVHRRLRRRDARRRGACARQARAQAHRHDRRESGRPRLRLRSRDERADGLLAGRRRARARRRRQRPARAPARRRRRRTLSRRARRREVLLARRSDGARPSTRLPT